MREAQCLDTLPGESDESEFGVDRGIGDSQGVRWLLLLALWDDCVGGPVCLSFSICFSGKDHNILGDHRMECAV